MNSKDTICLLRRQLQDGRCKTIGDHYFIPRPILDTIFANTAVNQIVAELECAADQRIGLVDAIKQRGRVVFAILTWMHEEDAIISFRHAGCLDSRLPLDTQTAIRIAPTFGRRFSEECQWQFIPHFFTRQDDDAEIDQSCILPIVREIGTQIDGGFGTVSQVEIHPSMQDLIPNSTITPVFIKKTLRAGRSEDQRRRLFIREKQTLRLLNCLRHPNIIPLLYSYTHNKECTFLFPPVQMDLSQFLASQHRHGKFQHDFTFISAMSGLASALRSVHQVEVRTPESDPLFSGIGYHHDLRPANVLVNNDTFILADFGMSHLKPFDQDSHTRWKAGAGDYLAPECMNEDLDHQQVGRAIDVWAFGCLVAEVVTFMWMGVDGISRFRDARLSPGTFSNWQNSYFYDNHGHIKTSVKQWLQLLMDGGPTLTHKPIHNLVTTLLVLVDRRPTMEHVCSRLSMLNVKFHFFATWEALTKLLDTHISMPDELEVSMKFWFERERLTAFGRALSLYSETDNDDSDGLSENATSITVNVLKELFLEATAYYSVDGGGIVYDKHEFENICQNLVQKLWNTLPSTRLRCVERLWINSMIDTNDIERLDTLRTTLGSESSKLYHEGAAMAMMRQIRLEMAFRQHDMDSVESLEIPVGDVTNITLLHGHYTGIYKQLPVIIERMEYHEGWNAIAPHERTLVMNLKAHSFNTVPKPQSLRLLNCLGLFEQSQGLYRGYEFVYQMPSLNDHSSSQSGKFTTLLDLLIKSGQRYRTEPNLNQPVLGDKYVLASLLANFLMEFHSIGWLHENFHSKNVVFFGDISQEYGIDPSHSAAIKSPYILGLHKSRPGGDAWHTEGPALEPESQIYQHPAYEDSKRFRYSYDYYSLGLVLLEIGLWISLKARSKDPKYKFLSPHELRDVFIKVYVPRLGPKMGARYRDVVHLLLSDGLNSNTAGTDITAATERNVFNKFIEEVVEPLEKLADCCL